MFFRCLHMFVFLIFFITKSQFIYASSSEEAVYQYICGINAPEDLINIPNSPWIIASGMGKPGSLYAINTESKYWNELSIIYPKIYPEKFDKHLKSLVDGDGFSPHGINININDDESYSFYMVNHGEVESIEIFEMYIGSKGPNLIWSSSIPMPKNTSPNSIVPLPKGGIAVTSIYDPGDNGLKEKMLSGFNTGKILEWHDDDGWVEVPESILPGNNGIEISPDGQWFYVTAWFGNTLTKISRNREPVEIETINLDFLPDNIRWSDDGSLIVAGHGESMKAFFSCAEKKDDCEPSSTIIKVDPETLEITSVIEMLGSNQFSTASVALKIENEFFVGTFAKNCIATFTLPID